MGVLSHLKGPFARMVGQNALHVYFFFKYEFCNNVKIMLFPDSGNFGPVGFTAPLSVLWAL